MLGVLVHLFMLGKLSVSGKLLPPGFIFREARIGDEELLLEWIKKLAEFERLSDYVMADEKTLAKGIFERKLANALFVETSGVVVAFAVWFLSYSTFAGKPVLFLEDIFVDDLFRGRGIATGIFGWLEARAKIEGCARMQWNVLDWNANAKNFYASRGGSKITEWETYQKHL
jgi:GNAT superfamily N-acetyltransferase